MISPNGEIKLKECLTNSLYQRTKKLTKLSMKNTFGKKFSNVININNGENRAVREKLKRKLNGFNFVKNIEA